MINTPLEVKFCISSRWFPREGRPREGRNYSCFKNSIKSDYNVLRSWVGVKTGPRARFVLPETRNMQVGITVNTYTIPSQKFKISDLLEFDFHAVPF